jgi:hypothetical protein
VGWRTRGLVVATAALVGVGLLAALWAYRRGRSADGPLLKPPPHGQIAIPEPGDVRTDGNERLRLSGSAPATITDVEVVGGEKSSEFLGAMIAGPNRRRFGLTQQFNQYPPEADYLGELKPAVGAVLKPHTQVSYGMQDNELLVGYRVIADEFAARTDIVISYTVDGEDFELTIPARLVTCPTTMTESECSQRADELFPNG